MPVNFYIFDKILVKKTPQIKFVRCFNQVKFNSNII